jgi:hypothetical protein
MVLDLDLNIHAGGEVELHKRVHRLRGRLHDVQQAAMRPDFELLAAFLVHVRGTVKRSIWVGSGIGPRTRAPVRLAVFTISFVLLSSTRWS